MACSERVNVVSRSETLPSRKVSSLGTASECTAAGSERDKRLLAARVYGRTLCIGRASPAGPGVSGEPLGDGGGAGRARAHRERPKRQAAGPAATQRGRPPPPRTP